MSHVLLVLLVDSVSGGCQLPVLSSFMGVREYGAVSTGRAHAQQPLRTAYSTLLF